MDKSDATESVAEAREYLKNQDFSMALNSAEAAVRSDPKAPEALRVLADALYGSRHYKRFLSTNLELLELEADDLAANRMTGWALWYTGQPANALPYLKKALALNPKSRTNFLLGNAYFSLGLYEQAETTYSEEIKQSGWSSPFLGLICTYLVTGRLVEAQEQNLLFRKQPDDDRYFLKAADAELLLGNRETAVELAKKALSAPGDRRFMPRGVCPSTILGCLLWNEDIHASFKYLETSSELNQTRLSAGDDGWEPRYDLAAIMALRGHSTAAYQWLEDAVDAGWRSYRLAARDPLLRKLHDESGFQRLMANVAEMVKRERNKITEQSA